MCGIAGAVSAGAPLDPERVEGMCRSIVHRGPDDGGLYSSPDGLCVLGNRRLAIIDLSPAGHMPMSTEDGRYWITYNGEIYNFQALRLELEARGHRFRSHTDTEVLLHLYQEAGERSVERLNGMFAFAIWDQQERTLFLARDRMGIKPLYLARTREGWVFASEIRAILASNLIPRVLDLDAAAGYLMLGSVPDDRTIVQGIQSLPPGWSATIRDSTITMYRFWRHETGLTSTPVLPPEEIEEAVREGLKDVVRRQMISDAPLGLFLSSGMDSTLLAALMRAVGTERIRSISIAFEEQVYDEGDQARTVAARFGLEHIEHRVSASMVRDRLDEIIQSMDQPTTDGINTYFVSWAARQSGLAVALSGLGADELFGGYASFRLVGQVQGIMSRLSHIPGHQELASLVPLAPFVPYRMRKLAGWAGNSSSLEAAYAAVRGVNAPAEVQQLLPGGQFDPAGYIRDTIGLDGLNEASAISAMESRVYMHNQLLRDTDSMSMAHSLEVRVPYLDNATILLATRCRRQLGRGHKPALALARSLYFPVGEPDGPKRGFSFPFQEWLDGPLAPVVESSMEHPQVLSPGTMRQLWSHYRQGRRHWSSVWTAAVLERWMQVHGLKTSG